MTIRLGLRFSHAELSTILQILESPTDRFVMLARVAGLDPARDFRGADLRGVDFGSDNLSGFDFSGADLRCANLSRAAGLDRVVIDAETRLPLDRAEARQLILAEARQLKIGRASCRERV